eukprot:Skav212733  [mRNA]  locus=scaffold3052:47699:53378:- [translate_table: standard]
MLLDPQQFLLCFRLRQCLPASADEQRKVVHLFRQKVLVRLPLRSQDLSQHRGEARPFATIESGDQFVDINLGTHPPAFEGHPFPQLGTSDGLDLHRGSCGRHFLLRGSRLFATCNASCQALNPQSCSVFS